MKKTINVNKELHKAIKQASLDNDLSIELFISKLMNKYFLDKMIEMDCGD